jgi:hypothetical protein
MSLDYTFQKIPLGDQGASAMMLKCNVIRCPNLQDNCFTALLFTETFNMVNNYSLYLIIYGEIPNIVITQAANHNKGLNYEGSWKSY